MTDPTRTPHTPSRRLVSRDLPCPTCQAEPGHRCTRSGRELQTAHPARVSAARTALADRIAEEQDAAAPASETPARIAVDTAGTAQPATAPSTEGVIVDDTTPPLTDREIAQRLLVIKALEARIAGVKAELRAQGMATLRVGDNVAGYLPGDDRALGRMGLAAGSESWKVTNPDLLQAWVAQHAPSEIVTRETVRNSYVTALVAQCKADGGWADPRTGELVVPDGITHEVGDPTLRVTGSKHLDAVVADAVAAGRINADGTPLALPAAGTEAAA